MVAQQEQAIGDPLAFFAEMAIIFAQLTIMSANELIRLADAALYQAKQNGRNQVAVASTP